MLLDWQKGESDGKAQSHLWAWWEKVLFLVRLFRWHGLTNVHSSPVLGFSVKTMQTSGLGQPGQLSTSSHPWVPVPSPSSLSLPLFLLDLSSQATLGLLLISQPQRNWDSYTVYWPFPHGCDNLTRNNVGGKKDLFGSQREVTINHGGKGMTGA